MKYGVGQIIFLIVLKSILLFKKDGFTELVKKMYINRIKSCAYPRIIIYVQIISLFMTRLSCVDPKHPINLLY